MVVTFSFEIIYICSHICIPLHSHRRRQVAGRPAGGAGARDLKASRGGTRLPPTARAGARSLRPATRKLARDPPLYFFLEETPGSPHPTAQARAGTQARYEECCWLVVDLFARSGVPGGSERLGAREATGPRGSGLTRSQLPGWGCVKARPQFPPVGRSERARGRRGAGSLPWTSEPRGRWAGPERHPRVLGPRSVGAR